MYLGEIFEQIAYGEFRKFGIGNDDQQGLQPADYKRVIPFINLALTELHKRFLLRSKTVWIQQHAHLSRYSLLNKYRQSDTSSTEPYKYIMDSVYEPFEERDLFKIEQINAEDGTEYILNEHGQHYSLFTPDYNTVEIPYPLDTNAMLVTYRADHTKLQHMIGDSSDKEIIEAQLVNISTGLLESLLLYAAGRYFMSAGKPEKEALGMQYLNRFEQSVITVKSNGINPTENFNNSKLENRGWR